MIKTDRLKTVAQFWDVMLMPDYAEFLNDDVDLRRAFHCAVSLYHLADWVFVERCVGGAAGGKGGKFTYTGIDGAGRTVGCVEDFADALEKERPHFHLIRRVANSIKHLELRKESGQFGAPSHAANTALGGGGYSEGPWSDGPYSRPRVLIETAHGQKEIVFAVVAADVLEMWKSLRTVNDW